MPPRAQRAADERWPRLRRLLRSVRVVAPTAMSLALAVGCETIDEAGARPDRSRGTGSDGSGGSRESAPAARTDGGLLAWLADLDPFKSETRAAVETGRVVERTLPEGSRQVTIDIDLSRGEGPRSLLCAVTRTRAGATGARPTEDPSPDDPATMRAPRTADLLTVIVRDDPRRMMLIDDAPAHLIVARERIALEPLPPAGDAVKRAGHELQARRSYRVPPGVLDRLTRGAPVQLVVPIGGAEVTRTIPGAVCEQIEHAG